MKYLLEVLFVRQYDQQYIYCRSHLWPKISRHFALFLLRAQSKYCFDQIHESLKSGVVQKSVLSVRNHSLVRGSMVEYVTYYMCDQNYAWSSVQSSSIIAHLSFLVSLARFSLWSLIACHANNALKSKMEFLIKFDLPIFAQNFGLKWASLCWN